MTRLRGFDPDSMVACTLVFEGNATDVRAQEKSVYRIASRHGGMKAGGENGERGYQLTFGIAYIRDFVMNHYVLGESFETSVAWSEVASLCDNVKRRLRDEHELRGLPGRPFVTCRVTPGLRDRRVRVLLLRPTTTRGWTDQVRSTPRWNEQPETRSSAPEGPSLIITGSASCARNFCQRSFRRLHSSGPGS